MTVFTLNDLVSYDGKHNEANGEDNKDGHDDNGSFNYGVEGVTDDEGISAVRDRQIRNFLASLILSDGQQQWLLPGQRGELGALGGSAASAEQLRDFVRRLVRLRKQHPIFRRKA
jgi:glycogen operon protein